MRLSRTCACASKHGGYDDLPGDMERFAAADIRAVLVVLLFDNLLPSFEAQLGTLGDAAIAAKRDEFRARLELALTRGSAMRNHPGHPAAPPVASGGTRGAGPHCPRGGRLQRGPRRRGRALSQCHAGRRRQRDHGRRGRARVRLAILLPRQGAVRGRAAGRTRPERRRGDARVRRLLPQGAGARLRQHALGRRDRGGPARRHRARSLRLPGQRVLAGSRTRSPRWSAAGC